VTHFFDANFVDSIVKDNDAARWNGINRLSFSDDDYEKVRGASVECLFPSRIVLSSFFFFVPRWCCSDMRSTAACVMRI
jgi:hypothetical protein